MPTYEYRCEAGHQFEQFQRMSEPPLESCPQCGARAERMLSAGAGLLFKGSGFYITDYRSDSYKKAAEADSGKSSPEPKSDTAPKKESGGSTNSGTASKAE
jgi:putative FmdB family regulatory protein